MIPVYRPYHPRWHRDRMPIFWWIGRASYVRFIARELTSLAVGWAAGALVVVLAAIGRGEAAYHRLFELLGSPWVIAWHALVLAGLLFHTVTWLNLAPTALVLKLRGRRVSDRAVVAAHYAAWAAVSALVVFLVVGA